MEKKIIYKMLIIGQPTSGRTSLFNMCVNGNFDFTHQENGAKIFNNYVIKITDYEFDINGTINPNFYKNINCFVIVISSDNPYNDFINDILSFIKLNTISANIIIFFNKSDLCEIDTSLIDNYMEVIKIKYGFNINYLIGSAKLNINIDKIFDIFKEIVDKNNIIDNNKQITSKAQSLNEIQTLCDTKAPKKKKSKKLSLKSKSCDIQ